MTTEELSEQLAAQPLLVAYAVLLFSASIICFVLWLVRPAIEERARDIQLSPWFIQPIDFGLFVVCLILWFVLAGPLFLQLFSWISGADAQPGPGANLLAGLLLQAGMLYIFLRFRFHFRHATEGPLSPRLLATSKAMAKGLFWFLATLPIIYAVGFLWAMALDLLRSFGWDINLPVQDAVQLFRQTDDPLVMAGFFFLAVLVAPIVEEFVFRGGFHRYFKGRMPLWLALLLSGTVFGLLHGNLQSLPGLITVGICLGLAYERTANLTVAITFHACFNLNSLIWLLLVPENLL
jgi:membrane protease YdiL (CAAX protease family)